ncbi:hypothetical protein DBB42_13030 [Pseudomonas plecoglossicida]|uniref:Uncharacterized protein n=1 Tax=Pseudomonas plecoglossicida TaxID=70775 RepID=A0A2R7UMF3_PSEDL|nr:hypothetical protein [Pseudomonas putida]KPM66439.1 hypothetical protein HB4184_03325 [Pseudomonas putida]PTU51849.1 hypothetical protein DBB42_13030 [Pseudomonas plecoglossicida]
MASDDDLRLRETARRQALWALAGLTPGDPRAADALVILDGIERQEQRSPFPSVPATEIPGGIVIVRDGDIPEPWKQRFHCASRGSTRLLEGAYWYDWEKFLSEWQKEMAHLEQHRCARPK